LEADIVVRSVLERAARPLMSSDSQIVLREKYETIFGIYDHDHPDPKRPLALVAMQPHENNAMGSLLYERIEQFAERKVIKYFGLSLAEFMELPSDVSSEILRISGKLLQEETKVGADALNQLQNANGAGK
jgi:hypothetical protein